MKLTDDILKALQTCVESLSPVEVSRRTGVGLETIVNFLERQTLTIREETYEKLYPALKPFLPLDKEPHGQIPPRIGPPARRHHDLVSLTSDEKILLDAFAGLTDSRRNKFAAQFVLEVPPHLGAMNSLSIEEKRLLSTYNSLSPEEREQYVLDIAGMAADEVRKLRAGTAEI